MTMGTRVETYNIESHGIDGAQYFQGVSTIFTPFEYVVKGIGETEAEAYEDAVEQIACGYDDNLVERLQLPNFWGDDEHSICEDCDCNGEVEYCDEACELHYYVSVYFNISKD